MFVEVVSWLVVERVHTERVLVRVVGRVVGRMVGRVVGRVVVDQCQLQVRARRSLTEVTIGRRGGDVLRDLEIT